MIKKKKIKKEYLKKFLKNEINSKKYFVNIYFI